MAEEHNGELNFINQRLDQIIVSFRETREDLKGISREMATKEGLKEHRDFVTGEIKEIKASLIEQDKVLANQDKVLAGVVNDVEKNSGFRNSVVRGRNYVLGALVVGLVTVSGSFIAHEQQNGTASASTTSSITAPVTNVYIKPTIQAVHPPQPDLHKKQ